MYSFELKELDKFETEFSSVDIDATNEFIGSAASKFAPGVIEHQIRTLVFSSTTTPTPLITGGECNQDIKSTIYTHIINASDFIINEYVRYTGHPDTDSDLTPLLDKYLGETVYAGGYVYRSVLSKLYGASFGTNRCNEDFDVDFWMEYTQSQSLINDILSFHNSKYEDFINNSAPTVECPLYRKSKDASGYPTDKVLYVCGYGDTIDIIGMNPSMFSDNKINGLDVVSNFDYFHEMMYMHNGEFCITEPAMISVASKALIINPSTHRKPKISRLLKGLSLGLRVYANDVTTTAILVRLADDLQAEHKISIPMTLDANGIGVYRHVSNTEDRIKLHYLAIGMKNRENANG